MPGRYAPVLTSTVGLLVLPPMMAALTFLAQPPMRGAWITYLVLRLVLAAAFTLTALLLAREPMQRANAGIFAATTVALVVGWIHVWTPTPIPFIASVASSLMWGGLAWVVLRYPHDRLDGRPARWFVVSGFGWLGVGHAVVGATYTPGQALHHGWPAHTWRPSIEALYGLNHVIVAASGAIDGLFVLAFLVLLARRIRRTSGLDRMMIAPMFAAGFAAAVPLLNRVPVQIEGTLHAELVQDVLHKCFLLCVPISFIVLLVRERLACAAVVRAASSGGGERTELEAKLRQALRDPALRLLSAAVGSSAKPGRVHLEVSRRDNVVAVLDADRALTLHPTLLQTVLHCCARDMEVEYLRVSIRGHLNDLAVARQDAVDSAESERSRIERDLHDGVQQRLLALNLRVARLQLDRAPADVLAATVRTEIKTTTAELRDLTNGQGSRAVRRSGLAPVVADLCSGLPIATTLDLEERRWSDSVEQAAYFVVCEALSNVIKHAAAQSANVSIRQQDNALCLEVSDDGSGLAGHTVGTGLRGLRDRVEQFGGEILVQGIPAAGTRLTVRIPTMTPLPSPSSLEDTSTS